MVLYCVHGHLVLSILGENGYVAAGMGKIQHPTCNQQKHPWSCDELSWSYKEVPYYLSNQSAFWHIGPSFATSKKRTAPRMLN